MLKAYTYDGLYIVCNVATDLGCGQSYASGGEPATGEIEISSVDIDDPAAWADACEDQGHDVADPTGYAEKWQSVWVS